MTEQITEIAVTLNFIDETLHLSVSPSHNGGSSFRELIYLISLFQGKSSEISIF